MTIWHVGRRRQSNIQRAFNQAKPGDRILVEPGRRTGRVQIDKLLVIKDAATGVPAWPTGGRGPVMAGVVP